MPSNNSVGKLCDEWVLSASVCVARSPVDFCSATTEAERRPLVFSVPIPLRTQNPRVTKSFFCFAGIQKISSKISDKIQLLYNECRGCTVVELLVTWIFCIWEEKKKIVSRVLDFFGSNITFLFLCGECATNTKI